MIGREEARLRALFQRLLLLSAATVPAACSSTSNDAVGADSGVTGVDATTGGDDVGSIEGGAPPDVTLADGPTGGGDASAGGDEGAAPSDASDGGQWGFADAACNAQFVESDQTGCVNYMALPCGVPDDTQVESCFLSFAECAQLCNQPAAQAHPCAIQECLNEDAGPDASVPPGPLTLECSTGKTGCGIGRRPEGLVDAPAPGCADAVGAWLAEAARLEAASVHAFRRLASELGSMRAPRALVRAAERSARDEIRHARVTSGLARRRGARPARVTIARSPRGRSLEAFAIENAVEGCVREAFGALVATHQARHARDPRVAVAMRRIARDETRHAALAWSIAKWLAPRLDAEARARLARATREAVASLREELAATPPDLARELGLPSGDDARAMLDGFAGALA